MSEGLSIIAEKYAIAMIQLGEKLNLLDDIHNDLYLIKNTVLSSEDLKKFAEHPLISAPDKKDVLDNIFKSNINPVTLNMIRLLADNNRLFLLSVIADYYNKLLCDMRNIDTAQVITAVPIDENTINRVRERLESLFNKQIKVETQVDDGIIAGMIVKIKDKIIDGSIKTKLENMKKQLIHS